MGSVLASALVLESGSDSGPGSRRRVRLAWDDRLARTSGWWLARTYLLVWLQVM